ncbi:LOT5 [Candida margitis]|uniref:LOT5 n=1 Tax=Candida margitis TaxID=1775924 RepID=UPI002226F2EB|nr:LOT5 [Candida margitis]KAI5956650.1 LOT5 [Candida margitis]
MPPQQRVIHEQPDIENTILYSTYQASSPARFSTDDDKFIMYGGGPSYTIQFRNTGKLRPFSTDRVSLFVLSSHFIVWSNEDNLGIEIPYQLIYLHALDKNSLYLQVQNSPVLSDSSDDVCEIRLVENNDHGNTNVLFTKVNGEAEVVYQAMSTCSAMHFDSDDSDDDETMAVNHEAHLPTMEIPENWLSGEASANIQEKHFKNDGYADDLDDENSDEGPDHGVVAGMSVDVGYASIAGSKRTEQDDQDSTLYRKRNKIQ